MKKLLLLFIILMTFQAQSSLFATNPISVEAYSEIHYNSNEKNHHTFWSNAKTWLTKKWYKIGAAISISKLSNIALITGGLSLILFFTWLIIGFPALVFAAFLVAIIGDIIAIVVLQKTREEKIALKKERRKARLGLLLSLLTGLIPLAVFAVVLVLLALD